VAWSLGTLFVLPILTGNVVIGAWMVVLAIPLGLVAAVFGGTRHSQTTAWLVFLAGVVVLGSVAWSATRVFSVALYRYATDGEAAGPFSASDLEEPFTKKRGWLGGR
jgi:hypothetical protein